MKILQLNVWTGRMKGALERFISESPADVICMQEAVWSDDNRDMVDYLFDSVDKLMEAGDYPYSFRTANYAMQLTDKATLKHGNVIISKIPIIETEAHFVLGEYVENPDLPNGGNQIYSAQKICLKNGLVVLNNHGFWSKDPLGDERHVAVMRRVADIIRDETRPIVMCGDLNVVAESRAMRELDFLRDLTAEYGIKQTLQNLKFVKDVPCDHILVNDAIEVKTYEALDRLVSDHKAVLAELEIRR